MRCDRSGCHFWLTVLCQVSSFQLTGELRLCGCRGQSQGPSLSHPISSLEQGSIALVDIFLHLEQCLCTLKGASISWCQWELWTSCTQRKHISLQLCHGCATKINNAIIVSGTGTSYFQLLLNTIQCCFAVDTSGTPSKHVGQNGKLARYASFNKTCKGTFCFCVSLKNKHSESHLCRWEKPYVL